MQVRPDLFLRIWLLVGVTMGQARDGLELEARQPTYHESKYSRTASTCKLQAVSVAKSALRLQPARRCESRSEAVRSDKSEDILEVARTDSYERGIETTMYDKPPSNQFVLRVRDLALVSGSVSDRSNFSKSTP